MVWDVSTPTGSSAISQGDDYIRELKNDLVTALTAGGPVGKEAIFPGPDTSAPVYRYRGLRGTSAERPAAGSNGLYFDETRLTLQRDNSTSWQDIAFIFPAGTALLFPQVSAPTGWTKVTSANDRALRVVSGSTGGETGGTLPVSGGLSHFHHVASHTHTIPEASIEHTHDTTAVFSTAADDVWGIAQNPFGLSDADATAYDIGRPASIVGPTANLKFQRTDDMEDYANGVTGGSTPDTDTATPVIAYLDVIWATKN
jgi:hypothetical protein